MGRDIARTGEWMLFCTQQFLMFFLAVFTVYWAMPWERPRVWLLLATSVAFYMSWNPWLAGLVVGTASIDFLISRAMDSNRSDRVRKGLLWLSVGTNLTVLGYLKYANFFLDSFVALLNRCGVHVAAPILHVIVPIGISFYTFEAISYTVDVYRRKIRAERNLLNFLVFILFFPHLVAGPIVRAGDFLPQVRRRKRWSWLRAQVGLQLCVLGMFKKMAIADHMALFADPVFADPGTFRTSALWFATLAYMIQVYCDFSGYSDLAIGTAHLLGYRLAWNFDFPYLAANVAEFWRRWHISLGNWLRDYLFLPLGGSRASELRIFANYLLVMSLCGLWHGAAWPFVMFGTVHGVWLGVHRLVRRYIQSSPTLDSLSLTPSGTALRRGVFLFGFLMTLVVFRTPSLTAGGRMFAGMFSYQSGQPLALKPISLICLALVVVLAHLWAMSPRWSRLMAAIPSPIRGLGYAVAISLALLLAPDAGQAFIYFQF
jgi:alginate O-acetyltransferase complex protein AlgI